MGCIVNTYGYYFFNFLCYYIYIWELFKKDFFMDILKKINRLRIERNWSIYRLSVESGVSQSTLNNMFSRETLPSITSLECICSAYGITLSEFFKEDNTVSQTESEQELLSLYRSSSKETQDCIFHLLRELSKKSN